MRRAVHPTLVVTLAVLAPGLAACGTTDPSRLVFVDAQLEKDTLATGGEMDITVRAGNAGDAPVALDPDSPCGALRYQVVDPAGIEVYPAGAGWACVVLGEPFTEVIPPDSIVATTHLWAAVHGYNVVGGSGEPLDPGRYQVIPYVVLADDTVVGDPMALEIIE